MRDGIIQNAINVFQSAFHDLNLSIPLNVIERLAVMIHNAMGGSSRNFHTLEHIFNVVQPADPLRCLAALFHDVVYFQVDKGFPPEIFRIISPYILKKDGEIYIAGTIPSDEELVMLTLDIFGFQIRKETLPIRWIE